MPSVKPGFSLVMTPWGTLGDLATAAFVVAAVSGVAVAVPYDSADAYGSLAAILLGNPAAVFFRNLHYWSAQACLALTLAHVWDRLRIPAEQRLPRGIWLRLAITLPILLFLMLSGFLLRGDADARQALRIVSEAITQVPLVGPLLATFAFGATERLDLVYVQHAATATIVVGLFVIEHARRLWPKPAAIAAVTLVAGALSFLLSPGLHDGSDPVVKGPWYFLGLQEILHWTPWPIAAVIGGVAIVAFFYGLRVMRPERAMKAKGALLVMLAAYGALCAVGAFLRGANWEFAPGLPTGAGNPIPGFVFAAKPEVPLPLPVAMGRPEGCLVCHRGVTGLGDAHRPEALGCASCHGGDVLTLDKARAHAKMIAIPGNLSTAMASCGQGACHAATVPRVERSLMATMSGVVAIDRMIFGEVTPEQALKPVHVKDLGQTPADTHLRQLCALCHLGAAKDKLGPNDEGRRGGGCNACHLSYSTQALEALHRYEREKTQGTAQAPTVHPALSLDIGNGQCFSCHSRSGRIATSYEGWHELHEPPAGTKDLASLPPERYRIVEEDRVFERVKPDIHHERGLDCIDCHTSAEIMGDGRTHARKRDQLRVACTDCHAPAGKQLASMPAASLDPESKRLLAQRKWPGPAAERHGMTAGGDALVNVVIDASSRPAMIRKRAGDRRELKPTARVCVEGRGHERLSCGSCHTAWAPRCNTCHTAYDPAGTGFDFLTNAEVKGEWVEKVGPFVADLPTLGVRSLPPVDGKPRESVDTFVPGMVMTLDIPAQSGKPAQSVFRRLYAHLEPHTTRREARSCKSCHNDPVALGFGRGELRYELGIAGGHWRFTPVEPLLADGLPADAWTDFLGKRTGMLSTREDVRPFSVEEQRRILLVGACLTCHEERSSVMRDSVRDFKALLARRRPHCVLPAGSTSAPAAARGAGSPP